MQSLINLKSSLNEAVYFKKSPKTSWIINLFNVGRQAKTWAAIAWYGSGSWEVWEQQAETADGGKLFT